MPTFISQQTALTWFLPIAIALFLLLMVVSRKSVSDMLDEWPEVKLRESRWGIISLLSSGAFFIFGVFLTVLTIYLSAPDEKRNPFMLGFAIVLFILGLMVFFLVVFLGLRYRKDSSDVPILTVTETNVNIDVRRVTQENNVTVIRIPNYEVRVITLSDKPVTEGEKHDHSRERRHAKHR